MRSRTVPCAVMLLAFFACSHAPAGGATGGGSAGAGGGSASARCGLKTEACTSGSCCSGMCSAGICACTDSGGNCQSGTQCCSGVCAGGVCTACNTGAELCSTAANCCSGVCASGVCSGGGGGSGGAAGGGAGGSGGGSATLGKPNVMLLLDKSGSMSERLPGAMACGTCSFPNCNETSCPTRMGQMLSALATFLTNHGTTARFGLTMFPSDAVCGTAATQQLVAVTPASDAPADLQTWANDVNAHVQNLNPAGGTPTAFSLAFVGSIPELNDSTRAQWVVVVTDGLPNCNATNPNTCVNPTSCKCTLNGGNCGTVLNDSDPNSFCRRGCLDQTGTTDAVMSLRAHGIRTVAVGFGGDFASNPDGFAVLGAMANAGGYTRRCPNGNECAAGDTCMMPSHVCGQSFYTPQNATELAAALADIVTTINLP